MKVALISGTSIASSRLFSDWAERRTETPYGEVAYRARGDCIVINRHGFGPPLPPHAINYRANVRAVRDLGFETLLSLNSVGSLQPELTPGSLVSCADYVSFLPPETYWDRELRGTSPGIDNNLIEEIAALSPIPIQTGKVYVQMRGPRFETKAEIRILRQWGDVVGMTLAGEADLCREIGIRYNSLAMVDNYANGVMDQEISFASFKVMVARNQDKVDAVLRSLAGIFG